KAEVERAGLFQRTYFEHISIFLLTLLGLGVVAYVVILTDSLAVQIANGVLAGFLTVQLGLIGHDLSHQGVFKDARANTFWAVLVWGLGCGLSESRWYQKHNAHHKAPNHIGHDPDVEIPFVFEHEQAIARSAFQQHFLFPYQHILFWVGVWFVYPHNLRLSITHLFGNLTWRAGIELILMAIHFIVLIKFTLLFLPPLVAGIFTLSVILATGVYMALIFAPNHKGEDMLEVDKEHNWVHQITLSRNITPSFITSYIFGGLECQIEHHLFPTMSRFHYVKARQVVRRFCAMHHIPYHETSWLDSLQLIHEGLRDEAKHWQQ
ncbi:acyl-CoA desaturase, partial [Candidatus Kaiserbacteria bacterium]|nr:acyl-CoA desaturase [Candidatus Kaiserbacteria bacterium]